MTTDYTPEQQGPFGPEKAHDSPDSNPTMPTSEHIEYDQWTGAAEPKSDDDVEQGPHPSDAAKEMGALKKLRDQGHVVDPDAVKAASEKVDEERLQDGEQ